MIIGPFPKHFGRCFKEIPRMGVKFLSQIRASSDLSRGRIMSFSIEPNYASKWSIIHLTIYAIYDYSQMIWIPYSQQNFFTQIFNFAPMLKGNDQDISLKIYLNFVEKAPYLMCSLLLDPAILALVQWPSQMMKLSVRKCPLQSNFGIPEYLSCWIFKKMGFGTRKIIKPTTKLFSLVNAYAFCDNP